MTDTAAVESITARVKAVYGSWRRDTTVAQMRADWDRLFSATGDASIEPIECGGVPCQWIAAPGARADKVIVYLHGGGFQVGSLASHRQLMGMLSAATGVRVLGVGYRLAPEHRFPAALDDAVAVWQALLQLGFSAADLAMAGDSAGGGLALAAIASLLRKGQPAPAGAFVMSALTDLAASGSSYEDRAHRDPIHQRPLIQAMARVYLGAKGDPYNPLGSPIHTEPALLGAFPPVLLQVGERETLVSDSQVLAIRLNDAGTKAELQIWPGMIHVFQQFPSELPQAREALYAGGRFLAARLGVAPIEMKSST